MKTRAIAQMTAEHLRRTKRVYAPTALIMTVMELQIVTTLIVLRNLSASAETACAREMRTVKTVPTTVYPVEAPAVATVSVNRISEKTVARVPMIVRVGRPADPQNASAAGMT
jgi:hypothetical protein